MNKLEPILCLAVAALGLLLCPGPLKILPGLLGLLTLPATCHVVWTSLPPVRRKEEKRLAELYEGVDLALLAGRCRKDPSVGNVRELLGKGGVSKLREFAASSPLAFKVVYEQVGGDRELDSLACEVEDVQKSPEWKLFDAVEGRTVQ